MYSLLLLVDSRMAGDGSGYSNLPHILEAKSDRLAICRSSRSTWEQWEKARKDTVKEGTHLLAVYRRNPSCKERVRDRIERKNQRLLGEFQFCGNPTVFFLGGGVGGGGGGRREEEREGRRGGGEKQQNKKDEGMNG